MFYWHLVCCLLVHIYTTIQVKLCCFNLLVKMMFKMFLNFCIFTEDYQLYFSSYVPYRDLGFKSMEEFILAVPDTIRFDR